MKYKILIRDGSVNVYVVEISIIIFFNVLRLLKYEGFFIRLIYFRLDINI